MHTFIKSGNIGTCPFCKTERNIDGADEGRVRQMIMRMEANDASAMCELGRYYKNGLRGLQQDQVKAIELMTKAAALGSSRAHFHLGEMLFLRGDLKKGKFHLAAAAMEGHELTRYELEASSSILSSELWIELLSIWRLRHLLGIIFPCIV